MAENIFPDLQNEEFVAAIEALKANETPETQTELINHALKAKYFAPVDVLDKDGNALQGNGKMEIPKDAKFNFKLIKNGNGEEFFMLFTDIKEFQKWNKSEKINTIVVVFPQMAQLAMNRADVVNGFVINPMSHNIVFSQETLKNILDTITKNLPKIKEAQRAAAAAANGEKPEEKREIKLFFGKPTNVPDSVLESLRKSIKKHPEVNAAYFSMMKQENQEFYLFTFDITADAEKSKKIADSVAATARLFLTKFPVIAAPVSSPYGDGAKKVGEPFYTK